MIFFLLKASIGFKIILMIFSSMALQQSIFKWCRDHRLHHKYSDTEIRSTQFKSRIFFLSHGMAHGEEKQKSPGKRKQQNIQDLLIDPIVSFNHKYYTYLSLLFWGIIPVITPVIFWQESIKVSITINIFR